MSFFKKYSLFVAIACLFSTPVIAKENSNQQINCLAQNAYFEAGNQPIQGKIAVSYVVMNRVGDKRFSDTPCGVIHQKHQFSWYNHGNKKIKDQETYQQCVQVARQVYFKRVPDNTHNSNFYHANYVNPRWGYTKVARIGAHYFYKG